MFDVCLFNVAKSIIFDELLMLQITANSHVENRKYAAAEPVTAAATV